MTVTSIEPQRLTPDQRATLIHRAAMSDAQRRLWRAALGGGDAQPVPDALDHSQCSSGRTLDIDAIVAMATGRSERAAQVPTDVGAAEQPCTPPAAEAPRRLGPNSIHAPALTAAASRTGLPATALAAIVNAEAAKDRSGRWNCFSRNPRSSAAGLGQFLSGTWIDMAQRSGSWLNEAARARGWLDAAGRIKPAARAELLRLRYDATASIETTADYARTNLTHLGRKGVAAPTDSNGVARLAYLAHHLGPGDAVRYLKTGLDDRRAATLLNAQIGRGRATQAIAQASDASSAHRAWLDGYVARNVRPLRFA